MAVINGTSFQIFIPTEDVSTDDASTVWLPVAASKSCTLNVNADTPDASTKGSAGWAEFDEGQKNWDVSFDGLVDFADSTALASGTSANFSDLYTYLDGRNTIKVAIGVEGTDEEYFYGDAFVNSISATADLEQPVSFSGTAQGTGALTKASIAAIDDTAGSYPNA